MDPETGWCQSSSDDGHNCCPTGIGDNSVLLRGKCGNRLYDYIDRGRASTVLTLRGEWRSGALPLVSGLCPHFLRGGLGGERLLVVEGRRATG